MRGGTSPFSIAPAWNVARANVTRWFERNIKDFFRTRSRPDRKPTPSIAWPNYSAVKQPHYQKVTDVHLYRGEETLGDDPFVTFGSIRPKTSRDSRAQLELHCPRSSTVRRDSPNLTPNLHQACFVNLHQAQIGSKKQ